ncbi:Dihydrolipoyl dehydrogenase [Nitrospira japonica]|uniref:Dihydrolipoyl dehydrogenase n=1 Tax=Nitrospira japonica TaxID=1325564 RepID=A0A1W1IA20_9BACT|nr:dihydrolipoyl dehydrogenase [Nitrospira japonica]SLM49729.1 Dihydrolipoyl dehydrogenase [Nitrospira japonica]
MPKHIVILGAGPGGYVAAIRAAQLGARVSVVEAQALGGVCLNWGCIPSKALLAVVELGDKLKHAESMGLVLEGNVAYDLARMVSRKNKVVETLVKGIATLFKSWDIRHLEGVGTIRGKGMVHVALNDGTEQTLEADAVVIATGSSWPNPSQFPIDGRVIVTSRQLLDLSTIPRRLLILGGGVEGCEFATLYSGLGTEVTVVELVDRILPLEDEEVSATMARELKKRGVTVMTGTTVDSVERGESAITVHCKNGEKIVADMFLVSVGRGFNSRGLGLEEAGVELGRRGEILVNERMETTVSDIYAIGDVVGKAMLAHVASAQGKVAVENIMGHRSTIRYEVIPAGIFTLPEIGRVGLTEAQARERMRANGLDADAAVKVGRFRFVATGKAQATGETTGFCKIISESESGRILGAHIIGSHAADLIHEAALAMEIGANVNQIADMIHAHPTMAEGMMEAAEDSGRGAIHQVRKRANR